MFDSYKDIFNKRGQAYHQAMLQFPLAREQEFQNILQVAEVQAIDQLYDIPSGGCYLASFVDSSVEIVSVESSAEFISYAPHYDNNRAIVCEDLGQIPLQSDSADRIVSLAGLHHLADRDSFYCEAYRLLKSGGILAVADVRAGSGPDRFLNGFVDQHNSMGHKGDFFDIGTQTQLEAAHFTVDFFEPIAYHWVFNTPAEMAEFCQLLFGIDKASPEQVLQGIEDCLGYDMSGGKCRMNWELFFFRARKL